MLHALNLEPKPNRALANSATQMAMDVDEVDATEQNMNIGDQTTLTQEAVNDSQDSTPVQTVSIPILPNQDTEGTGGF